MAMRFPSRFLQRFIPYRIWHQIFFVLVFLVVIPTFILGILLINTSQKAIKTTALHDYKEIAIHTTGEIKEHIKGAKQALVVTASILGTLQADPWRQETSMVELSLRYPLFQRISSVNLDGLEIATSRLGTNLLNRSREEAFKKAKTGESFISEVRISRDHTPALTIAVPIRQMGRIKGVLMADVNLRGIWGIVDNIQLGETGEAYLIDRQGRIIAHQDKKVVLQNTQAAYPGVTRDVLSGLVGSREEVDPKGRQMLVSYAPLEELGWGLIMTQSGREAYAFLDRMKMQSWIIIGLSILAAVMFSFILSRLMSRPINDLIERTQYIARGDFSHPFRIRRKNEVGRLLFSFNRMTQKLREAQEMEKLSAVGRVAGAIAHELKNSLLLVTTFVRLLPERYKDRQFIKEFSDTIPKELDSWKASLQNMMEFSADSKFPMTEVDVNGLARDVALLARLKAQQRGVGFDVRCGRDPVKISGNENKMKQVLLNLVTNSLEAMPRGGKIILSTRMENEPFAAIPARVVIEVTNTGPGIDEKDLARIFEPFYTTKPAGLGLGLSIVKDIVEKHQGHIEVENEEEEKVVFRITIPAAMDVKQNISVRHSRV